MYFHAISLHPTRPSRTTQVQQAQADVCPNAASGQVGGSAGRAAGSVGMGCLVVMMVVVAVAAAAVVVVAAVVAAVVAMVL